MASTTVVSSPRPPSRTHPNFRHERYSFIQRIQGKQQKNIQERISAVVKEQFSDEEDVKKQVMRGYERVLQSVMKDRPKVSDCAMGVIVAELIEKTDPDFEFSISDVMILTSWASERLVFADGTSYVDFL